ncbi:GumC family protein [Janthinobacterium aquaticum]|uniref:GumC family protein n=1 Tax=Janthinobacterium sp. FT58W TaxID=2654254 RepID=UPI001263E946|nr:Wzz/FepE/Etk N-terminal domain-containing protein [Janthinobacterium sp. FT58W]KAB8044007.1 lipopolysaccharide biosynthesis protein [Janthinobacterium sp. FT58W]
MNDTHAVSTESGKNQADLEFNFFDMLIVLAKRKKLIIGLPLAVAVISAAISLVLPNLYQAKTKLLPPQQSQSGASALLSQLGGVAGLAAGAAAGIKNPSDLYVGILKSRTVTDKLVAKFDLKKRYDTETYEAARNRLQGRTTIIAGKDGMISIEVEDEGQKDVAGMTNAYVEELQRLTQTLALTEASQRRVFYERELEAAKNNLAKVEISLKGAIDTSGVISVDSESRAILETAARLKAQVSAKEIQLGSMRAFVTTQNPEFRRASEELASLRNELSRLEGGRAGNVQPSDLSKAGLDNIQLMRDLKYYQMLYELLAKQYELARLDEAKDPSLIQVLDPAMQPERKSNPKRALIVIAATLISGFFIILWVLFSAAQKRAMTVPANAARWNELRAYLRFR